MNTTDHVTDIKDPVRDARNSAEPLRLDRYRGVSPKAHEIIADTLAALAISPSPTPRSDAAKRGDFVRIEVARTLERELAQASTLVQGLRDDAKVAQGWIDHHAARATRAEAELANMENLFFASEQALNNECAENAALRAALENIAAHYRSAEANCEIASAALAKEAK